MHVLPPELMEIQLSQIELLSCMYPEEGSFMIDPSTEQLLNKLKIWLTISSDGLAARTPLHISSDLSISVKRSINGDKEIQVHVTYPLHYPGDEIPSDPPPPILRIDKPSFMNRKDFENLHASIASLGNHGEEVDVVNTIQMIEDAVLARVAEQENEDQKKTMTTTKVGPLVRVWFYFPSISTRSKRDDLINHAPSYNLTGFLLAGKPGFLCLEGTSGSIDDYMKFIKTESWGDIPAHHKKVSERYRESGKGLERAFGDMSEVTDDVGERRGERANRTDMKALEVWLGERGFGDVMRKLVI